MAAPPIRIEPWSEGDLPLLEKLMGDPAMTEHLGGPESPEKIAERQQRYERLTVGGTGRMFKIVDSETGESVGSVGYWERESHDEHVYETGWSVLPEFQGRGIATSATAKVIEKARAERKL
jgi:RimJ/RimL family protein N-acetyltransferase